MLADACRRLGVPAAQLGLLRGGEVTVRCHGCEAATPFHAGSIAKALTAALVLDAGRRGELDVDLPASVQGAVWNDTPRALMAQTTGRPNLLPAVDEEIEAFVARAGAAPRVHAPGRFSYCNAGWPVLDLLLRSATGRDFEALAAERVLGPLGVAARFGMPPDGAEGHAVAGPGAAPRPVPDASAPAASAAGSRWWATAGELLAFASAWLSEEQRAPHAAVPGRTFADAWALGLAVWERGPYRAVGWSGYTSGHRAFLRVFPEHDAALVLLTNSAGPLFGGAGGTALFDELLPAWLDELGVGRPDPVSGPPGRPVEELAGAYGPAVVEALPGDRLSLSAPAMGVAAPLDHARLHGDTFAAMPPRPGGMAIALDDGLLYLGPFAIARS